MHNLRMAVVAVQKHSRIDRLRRRDPGDEYGRRGIIPVSEVDLLRRAVRGGCSRFVAQQNPGTRSRRTHARQACALAKLTARQRGVLSHPGSLQSFLRLHCLSLKTLRARVNAAGDRALN
jgi:hypothetical protein